MIDRADDRAWRRFAEGFAVTALGLTAFLLAFIWWMDPFGIRAAPGRMPSPLMDLNQRFMYPQLIRGGRYDSAVFGTSTIRLLDPARLGQVLGGQFMNLGMNAATPWEQLQIAELFLRKVPSPSALVFGIDPTWCESDADQKRLTFRAFPPWLYDDEPLNDYPELVNLTALEIAGRVALHRLGLMPARIPDNGYEIFVPEDGTYDLTRARYHLSQWLRAGPPPQPYRMAPDEERRLVFPALRWLDAIIASVPATASVTLIFPPNHVRAQPVAGTREAALEDACKAQIAAIARTHGRLVVDFQRSSLVTTEDANYWDPLHYRIGIAQRIVDALGTARSTGQDAPDGFYKVLNPHRR